MGLLLPSDDIRAIVFDVEANGLLDEVDEVWCMAGVDTKSGLESFLDRQDLNRETIIEFFKPYNIIIGHNIIGYDIPLIKKMYNLNLYDMFEPKCIHDTYIFSRCLFPDRPLPVGCPSTIRNSITKKMKKIGPHSLEAHGYSVGVRKIEINDWTVYDENIVQRCLTDVKINLLVYNKLLKEASL
jgi:hypothetical protein